MNLVQKLLLVAAITLLIVHLAAYLSDDEFTQAARIFLSNLFRMLF